MKKIFLLSLLISTLGFAQQTEVKVDLKTPHSTIYTHLFFLQADSYQPGKAAAVIYGYEGEEAQNKAIKLKKILDGRGLRVDMSKLPRNADFIDTTNIDKTHTYVLFPNRMPSIYLEKIEGKWYYSVQTITDINALYSQVYPWGTELLKSIIPNSFHKTFLNIELWQYLGFLILILLSYLVFHLFKRLIYFVLRRIEVILVKNTSEAVNEALNKLSRPITLLFVFWVFERLLPMLQLPLDVNSFLFIGIDIAIVIFWIYVFLKLVQVVMQIYAEIAEKTDSKLDDQLVPILNNILRVIVIVIGAFNLLKILGINTTALIAGASIGGLALAFASQDTVKNLIGTFMIFLDKPFQIGDWIEAGSVVGTVEEVGFRSTRVRAADTSLYQIPNSTLSEMIVNNKGLRLYRRYNTKLGLRYDTPPELIEAFVDGVRAIIKAHPHTRSDAYNVEFTGFGDSALLILMNTYFISLGWGEEQSDKHMLHLAIVKLAAALGVDFAFPSTTVIIEQFPDKKGFDMKYQTDQKVIDEKIKKILEDFKTNN